MKKELTTIFNGVSVLHQKSAAVSEITSEIRGVVEDMIDTMYQSNGIGLAAVQIGILKRIFVVDIPNVTDDVLIFINPLIEEYSRATVKTAEGCLSVPGFDFEVERSRQIVISYTDLSGERKTLEAADLLAVCLQHEYDHLEGLVYLDRIEKKYRKLVNKNFKKQGNDSYFDL